MKNLLNLEGVKALSKMEQKSINGGEMLDQSCTVMCNNGNQVGGLPNCGVAADAQCPNGWSICTCL